MDQRTILLRQMAANHNEPNWFVPIERALDGLTDGQAEWKSGSSNSIKEIVIHLVFWNERYLMRFKGTPLTKQIESNDETFKDENHLEWGSLKTKLYSLLADWQNTVKEAETGIFSQSAHQDRVDPWYSVIANVNIHNAYHIGQIVEIRKTQGSWDSAKGVH